MTKLLDRAIARVQALNEAEQDEAAEILLWAMGDSKRRGDDAAPLAFDAGFDKGGRIQLMAIEPAGVGGQRLAGAVPARRPVLPQA